MSVARSATSVREIAREMRRSSRNRSAIVEKALVGRGERRVRPTTQPTKMVTSSR